MSRKSQFAQKGQVSVLDSLSRILCSEQYFKIVSWTNSGRAFNIKDKTKFIKEILPLLFGHQNFPSFVRQMKAHGFKQLKRKEGLSFYLKGFQKNKPYQDLLRDQRDRGYSSDGSYISGQDQNAQMIDTRLYNNNINLSGAQMDANTSNIHVAHYPFNNSNRQLPGWEMIQQLIKENQKRSEAIENSLKTLEDDIDSSIFKHKDNKDLTRKVHILERAMTLLNNKGIQSEEMKNSNNFKPKQETAAHSKKKSTFSRQSANQRFLDDFNVSSEEQEELKQKETFNHNNQLHSQVLNITDNLIYQLANYMQDKVLTENPQVNQIVTQVKSKQNSKEFKSYQTSDSEESYSYELINLKKPVQQVLKKRKDTVPTQHNTCIHSNEESQSIDSSFICDDHLITSNLKISSNNLSSFANNTNTMFEFHEESLQSSPNDAIFGQDFNWNMGDAIYPNATSSLLLENEEMDLDNIMPFNPVHQSPMNFNPNRTNDINTAAQHLNSTSNIYYNNSQSKSLYQNDFNQDCEMYMDNFDSSNFLLQSPLDQYSLQ
ncbi:heat shock transcription [Stylonychia lemnae]|uniref:Heat shock transcription n=1 Tax=Stylonychia lemnae TaxID=5949 RepID=A0A078A5F8_STYLE|nr:heat shock transcription [Stylonychia lemnae]|eukprot:CDW76820.1 heat shock transcription [Stylonychia lemnae]